MLGTKVARAKKRAFGDVMSVPGGWDDIFGPRGQGGNVSCCVCRRDPQEGETFERDEEAGPDEDRRKCPHCKSFEELARDIAHEALWIIVDRKRPDKGSWREVLYEVSGFRYRFWNSSAPQPGRDEWVYRINEVEVPHLGWGFRFIANVTPTLAEEDRKWCHCYHPDYKLPEEEEDKPRIKDFQLMAWQAQGIERVGVLRMDVDGLGAIFGHRFDGSLPQLSALSAAMNLFFCGYLNHLCEQAEEGRERTIYTIYAGGDDLFVVGAWDRMPILARVIQQAFRRYTQEHPLFTLSGGVTLEGAHFPLYRAAERSSEAEHAAKDYERSNGRRKDSFCFLGTVVGWEEWNKVRDQKNNLLWLLGEDTKSATQPQKPLPRALLQVVQSIYQLYRADLTRVQERALADKKPLPNPRMFWGRWIWMRVYSLTRMARSSEDKEVRRRIKAFQREILEPETVCYAGLAARWAEYLTRMGS